MKTLSPPGPLEKNPTSITLYEGANAALDALAARLTLYTGRRHTRADAHRLALCAGVDAVAARIADTSTPSPAADSVAPYPTPEPTDGNA